MFIFRKNKEQHSKCPSPIPNDLSIKISTTRFMAEQLKKNTWDKNLADKVIENLKELERIIHEQMAKEICK